MFAWKLPRRAAAVAVAAILVSPAPVRADQLDRVVVRDASEIAGAVAALKAKNVAVLKFQVKIGDADPSLLAGGSAGVEMQRRIENILILTLDPTNPKFAVLGSAGEKAAEASRAAKAAIDWTTPDGRKKLFDLTLPVVWDEKAAPRAPDAYVTGTVEVSADFQKARVKIVAFTKDAPATLKDVRTLLENPDKELWILTDRSMLASLGRTFATSRELKPTSKSEDFVLADRSAAKDAVRRGIEPKAAPPGAVELKVLFDGKDIPYEPARERGEYRLTSEGKVNQRVTFKLRNNHDKPLAVLLCVNGQNTIALEGETISHPNKPRANFVMYVLEPKVDYTIEGVQTNRAGAIDELRVLPQDKSEEAYAALSPDVRGKIHLFVYGPKLFKEPFYNPDKPDGKEPVPGADPQLFRDEGFGAAGLVTAGSGLGKSKDLKDAQDKLADATKIVVNQGKPSISRSVNRSLIGRTPGGIGAPLQTMKFSYDEQPLDSLVITYFRK